MEDHHLRTPGLPIDCLRCGALAIATASCGAWIWACGPAPEPTHVVEGLVSDLGGVPLSGALVSLSADVFATTDENGAFRMEVEQLPERPMLTTVAEGYTAWTLDTPTVSRLRARLRARVSGEPDRSLAVVTLRAPEPTGSARTFVVTVDTGQLVTIEIAAGFQSQEVEMMLPNGHHSMGVLTPLFDAQQGALSGFVDDVDVVGGGTTLISIPLRPTVPTSLALHVAARDGTLPLDSGPVEASVSCRAGAGSLLIGSATWPAGVVDERVQVPLFTFAGTGACDVVATYTLPDALGDTVVVGFVRELSPATLAAADPLQLVMPSPHRFEPRLTDDLRLEWEDCDEADLTEAFVDVMSPGGTPSSPLWSVSTEAGEVPLPNLPGAAWEHIAWPAQGTPRVRIIGRIAPGLNAASGWDWSGYHGYVASPWIEISDAVLLRWRRQ